MERRDRKIAKSGDPTTAGHPDPGTSLTWPLGRVVKEDMLSAFMRSLKSLLEDEEKCGECGLMRKFADTPFRPICKFHRRERINLAED